MKAFYDVDPKKIGRPYKNCWTGEEVPVVSADLAEPPFVICVAYDRDSDFDLRIARLFSSLIVATREDQGSYEE